MAKLIFFPFIFLVLFVNKSYSQSSLLLRNDNVKIAAQPKICAISPIPAKQNLVIYNPQIKQSVVYNNIPICYSFAAPDIRNLSKSGSFYDSTNPYGTSKPAFAIGASLFSLLLNRTVNKL